MNAPAMTRCFKSFRCEGGSPSVDRAQQEAGCCGQLHKSVDKPRTALPSSVTPRWACPPIAHLTTARRRRRIFHFQNPAFIGSALRVIASARAKQGGATGRKERA
jgi:hypothetical protein